MDARTNAVGCPLARKNVAVTICNECRPASVQRPVSNINTLPGGPELAAQAPMAAVGTHEGSAST